MNWKAAAIIITTLIIGWVMGALSTAWFVKNRAHQNQGNKQGFQKMIMRQLEIDQMDENTEVYNIVEKHIQKMDAIKLNSRQQVDEELDAFIQEISTQVPPEKANKIKNKIEKFKKRKHHFPKRKRNNFKTK